MLIRTVAISIYSLVSARVLDFVDERKIGTEIYFAYRHRSRVRRRNGTDVHDSTLREQTSVVFVVPHAADVVPGRCLVAAIALGHLSSPAALGYLRIFLPGDLL
jgi:hypothetical protein